MEYLSKQKKVLKLSVKEIFNEITEDQFYNSVCNSGMYYRTQKYLRNWIKYFEKHPDLQINLEGSRKKIKTCRLGILLKT